MRIVRVSRDDMYLLCSNLTFKNRNVIITILTSVAAQVFSSRWFYFEWLFEDLVDAGVGLC